MKGKNIRADMDDEGFHPSSLIPHPLRAGEDFYLEGRALVFTARYHLRRGYCCESGCRHCPFREVSESPVENCEVRIDAEKKDAGL
jgi:hypothetical protein